MEAFKYHQPSTSPSKAQEQMLNPSNTSCKEATNHHAFVDETFNAVSQFMVLAVLDGPAVGSCVRTDVNEALSCSDQDLGLGGWMVGLRPHVFPVSLQVLFFVLRTRFASYSFIHPTILPVLRGLRGVLSLPFLVNHISTYRVCLVFHCATAITTPVVLNR